MVEFRNDAMSAAFLFSYYYFLNRVIIGKLVPMSA